MPRRNELQEIFLGILLLIGLHIIAITIFIALVYTFTALNAVYTYIKLVINRNELKEIFLGIVMLIGVPITIILSTIFIALSYIFAALISSLFFLFQLSILAIGFSQLFYVIPLVIWLYKRRKWGLMKGVII